MFEELVKEMEIDFEEVRAIMKGFKKSELIGATIVFTGFMLMLLVLPMIL